MAKTKQLSQESSPQEKVTALIKKPETIVGAIVLGAVAIVASQAWAEDVSKLKSSVVEATTQPVTMPVEPPASEPVAQPVTAETTEEPLAAIEVLANTSTAEVVIAQANDTFWKIAKRHCGSGVQGYRIEQENGYQYKLLQPGDQIEVICE